MTLLPCCGCVFTPPQRALARLLSKQVSPLSDRRRCCTRWPQVRLSFLSCIRLLLAVLVFSAALFASLRASDAAPSSRVSHGPFWGPFSADGRLSVSDRWPSCWSRGMWSFSEQRVACSTRCREGLLPAKKRFLCGEFLRARALYRVEWGQSSSRGEGGKGILSLKYIYSQ